MTPRQAPGSARRSFLFTPGDSLRKLQKIRRLRADSIILDLEDAVAPAQKAVARRNVVATLKTGELGENECLVRVNATSTPFFAADLTAIVELLPAGIVMPKVETASALQMVDDALTSAELAQGRPVGATRLLALVETALGIMNIGQIAQASQRLDALMFGAEDLAADLGARRSGAGWELFYARSAVVTAAGAYDLQAVDGIYANLADLEGLEADASFARDLGYSGKLAIHPGQLDVIHRTFSPTATEIARARQIVAAYQSHLEAGSGVFVLDGRMVDMPIVRAARFVLERARLTGQPLE